MDYGNPQNTSQKINVGTASDGSETNPHDWEKLKQDPIFIALVKEEAEKMVKNKNRQEKKHSSDSHGSYSHGSHSSRHSHSSRRSHSSHSSHSSRRSRSKDRRHRNVPRKRKSSNHSPRETSYKPKTKIPIPTARNTPGTGISGENFVGNSSKD